MPSQAENWVPMPLPTENTPRSMFAPVHVTLPAAHEGVWKSAVTAMLWVSFAPSELLMSTIDAAKVLPTFTGNTGYAGMAVTFTVASVQMLTANRHMATT